VTATAEVSRILQVHTRYRMAGGEDTVVASHRQLLREANHEVRSLEFANPTGRSASAAQLGLAPWNPIAARHLNASLRDWRPQVAHVHNTWFAASPSVVGSLRSARIPAVMTLHNYRLTCVNGQLLRDGRPCEMCVGDSIWNGVRFRCYRDSLAASAIAAATIGVSHRMRTFENGINRFLVFTQFQRDLMIRAGLPEKRIEIVPNFVIDPGPRQNPPSQSDVLLYVGRLSPEKGVDKLVEAWARSPLEGLRLMVVGDGPLRPELAARQVPGLILSGRLSHREVEHEMLKARALLYPSICYEGQPLVLLEAMASGLPIVAPRVGGVGATLGAAAIWVGDGDWEDGLAAVAETRDEDLDSLGTSSRKRYLEEFVPAKTLGRLREVYLKAVIEGTG
jgi:glycosyltransferase involved in cell wall biosynthesis